MMTAFGIRARARLLTHGIKGKTLLFSVFPVITLFGAAISGLMAILCGCYGAGTVFEGYAFAPFLKTHPALRAAAPLLFGLAAALFLLFHSAFRFALQAVFFYRTAPELFRPTSFLSFPRGGRMLICDLLLALRRGGAFFLLLTPCCATLGAILLQLRGQGMPPRLLSTGLILALAQFLCAGAAAFVLNGRYFLTKYLLYLNPLLPARDAIHSSVLLMRGRLALTARCRIGTLPWHLLRLFWPTRPFAACYTGMLRAVLCETLYGEDKTKGNRPAVQFFIHKKTVFSEKKPLKKEN